MESYLVANGFKISWKDRATLFFYRSHYLPLLNQRSIYKITKKHTITRYICQQNGTIITEQVKQNTTHVFTLAPTTDELTDF